MSPSAIAWLAGDPDVRTAIEAELAGGGLARALSLASNRRRSVYVLEVEGAQATAGGPPDAPSAARAGPVLLKVHHLATGRHRLRERIKRLLGRSPARREWRALRMLAAAGIAVPRPLAYGRLPDGDELLAETFVAGRPVAEAFDDADDGLRGRLVAAIARAVERLARSGFVHGDLHLGNLRVDASGDTVVLLDLQRARRSRSRRARLRDRASLELSCLRAGWPGASHLALRRALGDEPDLAAALVRLARDRSRGRRRRAVGPGRAFASVRRSGFVGVREQTLDDAALAALIARAGESDARATRRGGRTFVTPLALGDRRLVVKHSAGGSLGRRLAAAVRGTPARRAFEAGLRDRALLGQAARVVAWLEANELGLPGESWLVLEQVGAFDLDRHRPASSEAADRLACALGEWLAALHAVGFDHRDLKGSNLRGDTADGRPRFWLVDLEDLHGPGRLGDDARLSALAALNASIADEDLPAGARLAALERYVSLLPFERPGLDLERARRELDRRSRARAHRYRGGVSGRPEGDPARASGDRSGAAGDERDGAISPP